MKPIPKEIKAADGKLTIVWNDGAQSTYEFRPLRLACRCAACVDEWSHATLIQPAKIPLDVKPVKIDVVGSYAIHIDWSDGHVTGIYSYDYLRDLVTQIQNEK